MKSTPYWWDDCPLADLPQKPVAPRCDVVIVGAGYTGLSAAITLARAGRSVQVFDRMKPGEGASTRNGGITSGNLRLGFSELTKKFGRERATAIEAEAKVAREDLYRFIEREKIDCGFALAGRFSGAPTQGDYDMLARDAEHLQKTLGVEAYAVPKEKLKDYLGTDFYKGGAVRMDVGGLQPAKLHAAMLRLAQEAGAVVHGETGILSMQQEGDDHVLQSARGPVRAAHVIMGTNGYTDEADKWLRRRLVPVRSRMIATEPLSPNMMASLMPRGMMCSDTRKLSFYYRPSPDGTRILFGGRDGSVEGDPEWPTQRLRAQLLKLLPDLEKVEMTHSWFGHVAMNRDFIPRIFSKDGRRYAAGYCGSGVVWARWAGQKAALQVLGLQEGVSSLDFRPPQSVPFFNGHSWFMPAVFMLLELQDRWHMRRS